MINTEEILNNVIQAFKSVIDPETGADVYLMRIVQNIVVHEDGKVTYDFCPSSPLCPIALPLVLSIMDSIKGIEGVNYQNVTVKNYAGADELNEILASLPASNP